MIKIKSKEDCSGCSACASICGKKAITMVPDALGFLYPAIDREKCVDCGLCDSVCSFNAQYEKSAIKPLIYGARHKQVYELKKSTSGALFVAFSDAVLEKKGVVYGAKFDSSFNVVHDRATNKIERDVFRGSKYVQSFIGNVFLNVSDDLREGLSVFFSGTPCQVSGLRSFLKKKKINMDSLILCDLVCHGVSSPFLWRDYILYLQKAENQKITSYSFRDKTIGGWRSSSESITFGVHKKYSQCKIYSDFTLRRSCYQCPFSNCERVGDISIGDYWGAEGIKDLNCFNDNKGISLVFLNTIKGEVFFDSIREKIFYVQTSLDKCMQPNLRFPTTPHPLRLEFERDYKNNPFEFIFDKYYIYEKKSRLKSLISGLSHFVKKFIMYL